MDPHIASRTARVRTLVARRPSHILVAALLLLLLAAAWIVSRATTPASAFAPSASETRIASLPSLDDARQVWSIPAPPPAPRVKPAPQVETTDWTALSLGVSAATPGPVLAAGEARPAELNIAMSDHERSMILATVKSGEPEGLPSPQGYTPGIVVIVPGGASADGICR